MFLKLLDKEITDDNFYLMVYDTLDEFVIKKTKYTRRIAESFSESLSEELTNIIQEAKEDWIEINTREEPNE